MVTTIKNKILNQKLFFLLTLFLLSAILFLWSSHAHAAATPPPPVCPTTLWQLLRDYKDVNCFGNKVYNIWNIFIKLANGFVVLLLIFVAFAQILRININTYGVKKVLPTLVLAIIAANFSFLFCRLLVDISSVIISLFLHGADGKGTNADGVVGALANIADSMDPLKGKPCTAAITTGCYTYGDLLWQSIGNLMILAGAVILLILAYLFIVRNWIIYFLVAMAPLAFMSMVIPQTKSLFNQWWTNFSKWVFMPVVSVFWIWVGSLWFDDIKMTGGAFISFVFAGVCFYLALTTPFKMGGAVMSAWSKVGQKTAKFGYNQYGGAASRMSAYGQRLEQRNKGTFLGKIGSNLNKIGGIANLPANVRAIQQSRKETRENLDKAAKKTGTYNRFLGPRGQFNALAEAKKDDFDQKSATLTGRDQAKRESAIYNDLTTNTGSRQARLFVQNHNGIDMTNPQEVIEAMRADLSTMNGDKLLDSYGGLGGADGITNADKAVDAKLNTRRYNQLSNSRQRAILQTAYNAPTMLGPGGVAIPNPNYTGPTIIGPGGVAIPNPNYNPANPTGIFGSSAVGTPTGQAAPGSPQAQAQAAQAAILTGQQGAASVVGAANAQALSNAAAEGEPLDEAVESVDDGALKVEIEKFNPLAKRTLEESYGKMQGGYSVLNRQDSEAFIDEAGEKSEEKAKLSGIIGKDGSEKLTNLANHSNLSFEDALKSSGINPDEMSPGALKVVEDTYKGLQQSKNEMIEETYNASKEEIEEELNGIKMVMGASMRHGALSEDGLKNTNHYLETAENFFKAGDMKQAQSMIETVSGKIPVQAGVTPEADIEKAIQKRIKHINQGLRHFEDDKIDISKITQLNQPNYIVGLKSKKEAAALSDAEVKTATHLASSNLVSNPKLQALPVTQIANNPVAMQELTNAITGLNQTLEMHGEQINNLAAESSGGGALNQVTNMNPAAVNAKSMVVDVLNKSIKDGIVGASTTVSQAFSSKSFRDNMAQGVKKALDESRVLKKVVQTKAPPVQPPAQSTPPPTVTPDGPLKVPNNM